MKNNTKKVFIIGSTGKNNFGDDAICFSLINILRNRFRSKLLLYVYTKNEYFKRNFEEKQNAHVRFVSTFTQIFKAFIKSEFIIIGGGDYVGDFGPFLHIIRTFGLFLSLAILSKMLFKKFIMVNQGFHVSTRFGMAFTRLIITLCYCTSVRDSSSFLLVSKYTCKKSLRGFDTAILLETDYQPRNGKSCQTVKNVGFSITPSFYLDHQKKELLAGAIARDINKILDNIEKINIYFLAFNTDPKEGDLSLINLIRQKLNINMQARIGLILYKHTIAHFLSQFQKLDAIICCKYHSIIFSYLFKKPMIVIGYHPKNIALIIDIDLPKRAFLSLEDILSGKLYEMLLELVKNPKQYEAKLPLYIAKRMAFSGVLNCIKL